jgi:hypothetical protein
MVHPFVGVNDADEAARIYRVHPGNTSVSPSNMN